MQLSTALSLVNSNNVTEFQNLAETLSPEIISAGLKDHAISTIRKRKLPMENMAWAVIGMALFRKFPMRQMLNSILFYPVVSPMSPQVRSHKREKNSVAKS